MASFLELQISDSNTGSSDTSHPRVRVELPVDCITIYSVLDDLIRPALLAAGFTESTVDKLVIAED